MPKPVTTDISNGMAARFDKGVACIKNRSGAKGRE